MSSWLSEYRVRCLAEYIAPRILPKMDAAVNEVFKVHLPGLLMEAIRAELGTEHAPKGSVSARRARDNLIRTHFNGNNSGELAKQFSLSRKQVLRIARAVK